MTGSSSTELSRHQDGSLLSQSYGRPSVEGLSSLKMECLPQTLNLVVDGIPDGILLGYRPCVPDPLFSTRILLENSDTSEHWFLDMDGDGVWSIGS